MDPVTNYACAASSFDRPVRWLRNDLAVLEKQGALQGTLLINSPVAALEKKQNDDN